MNGMGGDIKSKCAVYVYNFDSHPILGMQTKMKKV
jgi:hypothetical protein